MGCACRGGTRRASPRSFVEPKVTPSPLRSLCANVETEGNNTTVKVGGDGRLYLGDLPATSALASGGCHGAFSQAIAAASTKVSSIFMSPTLKARLQGQLPSSSVKLGFLRDILRSF